MNEQTPKCCEGCRYATASGLCMNRLGMCAEWRAWFRKEWARIRRAAQEIKNNGRK